MAYIILFTYSEELNFLSSPDIIRVNKRRRKGCAGLVEGLGSVKDAYKTLAAKLQRKRRLGNF